MEMILDRLRRDMDQADTWRCYDKTAVLNNAADEIFSSIKALHLDICSKAKTEIAAAAAKVEQAEASVREARRQLELERTKLETEEYLMRQMVNILNDDRLLTNQG